MKFKVNSKELDNTLSKVFPAVPSKTPVQILENFFVEIKDGIMSVYGTDMEMAMKSSLNVVAEGDFQAVISARKFYDTVRALEETELHFETFGNNMIKISWEKGEFHLSYLPASDFPKIPSFPADADEGEIFSFTISGEDLKRAIEKTSFAISKESFRQAMMGILFEFSEEGLRFVSTDGHRLINILYKNLSVETPASYVVPGDAVNLLYKVLDEKEVKIFFSKSHASFILNDIELIVRLIDERYPDYKSVIPLENEFTLNVNPQTLHKAVKRVMVITFEKLKRVKLNLKSDGMIDVISEDMDLGDMGKEAVEAKYIGDEMEIGFNAAYLSDVLSHLSDEEEIVMKLHSPNKAVVIVPTKEKENQELTMLLMPVRLNV
jgi:DNA polymerase-3 subunit beta